MCSSQNSVGIEKGLKLVFSKLEQSIAVTWMKVSQRLKVKVLRSTSLIFLFQRNYNKREEKIRVILIIIHQLVRKDGDL